jgi:phosphoglycerate dehydrogenase-like enzyme
LAGVTDPEIAVLQQHVHGIDGTAYAEALRERLPDATVRAARSPDEQRSLLATADIATGPRLGPDALDRAEALALFACVYAGTGHLDTDAFAARDVAVTNASGVHAVPVAEYVVGWMVAHARSFPRALDQQRRGEWRAYDTRELHGSTATVVGLGAIGQAVVDRLEAFGMETVGVRHTPAKTSPTATVCGFDEIHEAVADAAFVVVACPLTATTRGLIDESVLRTMRTDAVLVNVARGPVVETEALVAALRRRGIAGAALDVTDPEPLPSEHPLWSLGNVTITPHNAGHTPEYFRRRADILARNAARLDTADPLENRVV